MNQVMTSNQPYLLRAFYDWIVDNDLTPYIVVDATRDYVDVPLEFIKDGQIVLNISPSACVAFSLDNEMLSFQARFGGQPRKLSMPCHAILAIYARENGAGTVFATEEELTSPVESAPEPTVQDAEKVTVESPKKPPKKGKPTLKVIK